MTAALALGAAAADAATVRVAGQELEFRAGVGETNALRVTAIPDARTTTFVDLGSTLEPGDGCVAVSPHEVSCTVEYVMFTISVDLGDGDDSLDATNACAVEFCGVAAVGGNGSDRLSGSTRPDRLQGGGGDDDVNGRGGAHCAPREGCWGDVLEGGWGSDVIRGGAGPDRVSGGLGSDSISGGTGQDVVSYTERRSAVRVTLDGRRNDGAIAERDHVLGDVESVSGGAGADVLIGNARANGLSGGGGSDRAYGRGGADSIFAADGRDFVDGGTGRDFIVPGRGRDRVRGRGGDDWISAEDCARDVIDGGPGNDRAEVGKDGDYVVRVERFVDLIPGCF